MKNNGDMEMSNDKTIIGIHIPKTAGTSLRLALSRVFPENEITYMYRHSPGTIRSKLIKHLIDIRSRSERLPRIIYGHMGFGLHKLIGIGASYVTILRDPLKRAISLYNHEKRNKEALYHKEANLYNIKDFYSLELSPQFKNSMTRMIAGNLWQEVLWHLDGDDTHALEIARENIKNHFFHVGFTEYIDQTQAALSKYFGKSIDIGTDNRDPAPIEIRELDQDTVDVIKEKFRMDMELYEFARSLFAREQTNCGCASLPDNGTAFLSDDDFGALEMNGVQSRKICLVTCFLMTEETCNVLDNFSLELSRRGYDLIVLSAFTTQRKYRFSIIEIPYSLYDYGQKYEMETSHDGHISQEIMDIVKRDMAFQGENAGNFSDHLKGYFICERIFSTIVGILKPQSVFVWGPTLPQSAVQKNYCEKTGVPVFTLERGLLADTLMIDPIMHGTMFEENLEKWLERRDASSDISVVSMAKEYYMIRRPEKYSQTDYSESIRILDNLRLQNKKTIVFWGQHDIWSGLVPGGSLLARMKSPFYRSTREALEHLIESVKKQHDIVLIFKPHPHDTIDYSIYENDDVIVLKDINNHALFEKADVIAAMLTTTQFESLFYEKPIMLLANSQLKGKGIAYELTENCSLDSILCEALSGRDLEKKLINMKKFLSWMLINYLFGYDHQVPVKKTLSDLAHCVRMNGRGSEERIPLVKRIAELSEKLKSLSGPFDRSSITNSLNIKKDIKLIAFYLPQFHPIPENDEWWGEGFTEWTNVSKAKPLFPGHYQPHVPADLGYYDLRDLDARQTQADLAREYGIYGFCYYHYWFNGKRLLHYPLDAMLASGKPEFPFCLCWANENWSRRWDGSDHEILIRQNYSEDDDRQHIRWLVNVFKDKRYIRVQDKPLILIYKASDLPDPVKTMTVWREEASKLGIGELFICNVEGNTEERKDPEKMGFNCAVEFQPDCIELGNNTPHIPFGDNVVYDYTEFVEIMLRKNKPAYKRIPCVTPSWDNTPRRKKNAFILAASNPDKYERWLRETVRGLDNETSDERNIIFINAWNEWGEGNHLEPDLEFGREYLTATKRALSGIHKEVNLSEPAKDIPYSRLQRLYTELKSLNDVRGSAIMSRMSDLREHIYNLEKSNKDKDEQINNLEIMSGIYEPKLRELSSELQKFSNILPALGKIFEILKTNVGSVDLYLQIGELCFGLGLYGNAHYFFEKTLAVEPGNADALNNLGVLDLYKGNVSGAREYFVKALHINPDYKKARHNLDSLSAVSG